MTEHLYKHMRVLGVVSNDVPVAWERRGRDYFAAVSTGHAFNIYNMDKIRLILIGPQLDHKITRLALFRSFTYVATGSVLHIFKRGILHETLAPFPSLITAIEVVDQTVFVASADGHMQIWNTVEGDQGRFKLNLKEGSSVTSLLHPHTFINKLLVGTTTGIEMHNVATQKRVTDFPGFHSDIVSALGKDHDMSGSNTVDMRVNSIARSPTPTVYGVGFHNGMAVTIHLKSDQLLHALKLECPVRSISFRMQPDFPFMLAGGDNGDLYTYDLSAGVLAATTRASHDGPVLSSCPALQEPILYTAGANAIKCWIWDTDTPAPRLLRHRGGHRGDVLVARWHGEAGTRTIDTLESHQLITAGEDKTVRVLNAIQAHRSRLMSQGKGKDSSFGKAGRLLGEVTCMASREIREEHWATMLTGHRGNSYAQAWSVSHAKKLLGPLLDRFKGADSERRLMISKNRKANGGNVSKRMAAALKHLSQETRYRLETSDKAPVSAVGISPCGHYGYVASERGGMSVYSLQSGRRICTKQVFGRSLCFIGCGSGRLVLLSRDGEVKVVHSETLETISDTSEHMAASSSSGRTTVLAAAYHRSSGHLAVAVARGDIQLWATAQERPPYLAREFKQAHGGHPVPKDGLAFNGAGDRLFSAAADCKLDVHSIRLARVLDSMPLPAPPRSISVSPSDQIIAVTLAGRPGVYLVSSVEGFGVPSMDTSELVSDTSSYSTDETVMSGLSSPFWSAFNTLDKMDTKDTKRETLAIFGGSLQRSGARAPFFLPATGTTRREFDTSALTEAIQSVQEVIEGAADGISASSKRRRAKKKRGLEAEELSFAALRQMSPSDVDSRISLLRDAQLKAWVLLLADAVESGQDFDLVCGWALATLTAHGMTMARDEELTALARRLRGALSTRWLGLRGAWEEVRAAGAIICGDEI
eukprot:gnl/Dysnectes_brevis/1546_a1754_1396.p1 GENE.gnl/Dysnectes_brevis/1546_a1754_1396~~gnl/Dysnectes_brevis/1546_a1754_1396.p1  ORF type:complete len:929 (-),score=302.98 gnl/Dysnectes_brevis/1546_a1754_1396:22-2808(-)